MSAAPLATEGECALVGFTGTLRASIFVGMPSRLSIPLDNVTAFCRRHHIRWLALFGSVLRDDFCAGSDVDVLVEFEPGHVPGFRFIAVQEELAELLGRRVDLNTLACLSPYFRDRVLEQAEVQFD